MLRLRKLGKKGMALSMEELIKITIEVLQVLLVIIPITVALFLIFYQGPDKPLKANMDRLVESEIPDVIEMAAGPSGKGEQLVPLMMEGGFPILFSNECSFGGTKKVSCVCLVRCDKTTKECLTLKEDEACYNKKYVQGFKFEPNKFILTKVKEKRSTVNVKIFAKQNPDDNDDEYPFIVNVCNPEVSGGKCVIS